MPNTPSAQDQSTQNGHYRSSQGLSEEFLTLPQDTAVDSVKTESLGDDWSSLTKE